jgi:hypothetical protein
MKNIKEKSISQPHMDLSKTRDKEFLDKYTGDNICWSWVNPESIERIHAPKNSIIWNSKQGRNKGGQIDSAGKDIYLHNRKNYDNKIRIKSYVSPSFDGKIEVNFNLPGNVKTMQDGYEYMKHIDLYFLLVSRKGPSIKFIIFKATDISQKKWKEMSRYGFRIDRIFLSSKNIPLKTWKIASQKEFESQIIQILNENQ